MTIGNGDVVPTVDGIRVRPRRFGIGTLAAALKFGPKLLAVLAKLAKTLKLGKVALAGASLWAYSAMWSWKFAVLILFAISFHEYGHCWAMRRRGIPTRGFYLIPFVGGAAVPDGEFRSEGALAYTALMGPVFGLALAALTALIYFIHPMPMLAAAAGWMAFVNLFNLIPLNPLDGGRVIRTVAFSIRSSVGVAFLVLSVPGAAVLAFLFHYALLGYLALIGSVELIFEVRRHRQLTRMPPRSVLLTLGAYVLLVVIAWLIMHAMKHEPGAALALRALKA